MAGDFNRSPNSFNFDFEREAKNSLFKLMERYLVPVNPSAERTKSAKREPHPDAFSSSYLTVQCLSKQGISSLEYDTKGVYLASATKSGCLNVHDLDIQSPDLKEDEAKQLLHISMYQQLDVVRWNLANQDEIACTSMKSSEVHVFDIGFISSEPVQVLRKRPNITVHGVNVHKGFSDIAFSSDDSSRLLASDTSGVINVWDRRVGILFSFVKGKVAHELEKISPLKAQSNIISKEIHSIDVDPSCPYQLAFHLDDGWSGVLDHQVSSDTHSLSSTFGCKDAQNDLANLSYLKSHVGFQLTRFTLLDHPATAFIFWISIQTAPPPVMWTTTAANCKFVASSEDIHSTGEATSQHMQNRYLPLSESVTACVAHPLNGTIVAGTEAKKERFDMVISTAQ
ncbi:UNVERIFIED_CONTAM: hypothetical protein Scaly_3056800 [Sesamum calycinum]|uniref:Transducin/WD40 repeat-like superfamily protein n=1 Tax=Sesamum calycinum TaxID=2727403 RepID=A0AAW2K0E8_9LAMI